MTWLDLGEELASEFDGLVRMDEREESLGVFETIRTREGLCHDCGAANPREGGRCVWCMRKRAVVATPKVLTAPKSKSLRRAAGLCVDCCRVSGGARRCPACAAKNRAHAAAAYQRAKARRAA
jgi:hypothetical protein